MKTLLKSLVILLGFSFCLPTAGYSQETVTIKLYGSGGTKTINGTSSGKYTAQVGEYVELSTSDAGSGNVFAFFTKDAYYLDGGTIVSNKNPYGFTATENATFYINYEGFGVEFNFDTSATVTAVATKGGIAAVNGVNEFAAKLGDDVILEASADWGCTFINWTDSEGNVVSTDSRCTTVVTGTNTYTANFKSNNEEEGEETGIDEIKDEYTKNIYDLRGRRVENAEKNGLYIINGKTTLVR